MQTIKKDALVTDFPPKKSTKIASFEKGTKKHLVNSQITIWASENPENCDEPL